MNNILFIRYWDNRLVITLQKYKNCYGLTSDYVADVFTYVPPHQNYRPKQAYFLLFFLLLQVINPQSMPRFTFKGNRHINLKTTE